MACQQLLHVKMRWRNDIDLHPATCCFSRLHGTIRYHGLEMRVRLRTELPRLVLHETRAQV